MNTDLTITVRRLSQSKINISVNMFVSYRALLLISHGLGEHCLWYTELAEFLNTHGIYVFAHDHSKSFSVDLNLFSIAIPSLLQIQEGQLSVSDERMCTNTR